MKNPFRYGCVVEGEYFCPRPTLESEIQRFVESGQNIVVSGERRMGKTSLVKKAILSVRGEKMVYIDLYCIKTVSDFCRRVMAGIASVTTKMSFLQRAMQLANRLRPVLSFDSLTGSPSISIDARAANEPESLTVAMETLRKLAADGKMCIVFDEFQDILNLENADMILAEMRGTIQFQGDVPYFFLGSVRNHMLKIFTDSESPFFKSALTFEVGEIEPNEFSRFIVSRFEKGRRKIDISTAKSLIESVEGVSGDVQELCDAIWSATDDDDVIDKNAINAGVAIVFSREKNGFEAAIADLTSNQMAVLVGLAQKRFDRVYSSEFMDSVRMTSSGAVKRVLNKLIAVRIIYEYQGAYRFVNPFFREWLKQL